jgi:hypothetical protein
MSTVFVLGIVSGAVAIGLWRREIQAYAAENTRRIRAKAADGMHATQKSMRSAATPGTA